MRRHHYPLERLGQGAYKAAMRSSLNLFWNAFLPLFVAVDALGVLPLFVALTEGLAAEERRRKIWESALTAAVVALVFIWAGPGLMHSLGITPADFMIAGGILLLAISLNDLFTGEKRQRWVDPKSLGAVPLGVPLITGPAVLATCILLTNLYGRWLTTAAAVLNIALAALIFRGADPLTRALGRTGTKILSKLASLLMGAIAVMLIRKGILEFLRDTVRTAGP